MLIPKELLIEAKEKYGEKAATLIAKDLEIEGWDELSMKGCCPFHRENTPSFIWSNKDFAFKCFSCGKRYGILDHYIGFYKLSFISAAERLLSEEGIKFSFSEKGLKTDKDYKYPKYDFSEDRSKVEEYWKIRGISKETLDYLDVQQDSRGNTVLNYYDTGDVLTMVKYRPSRKVNKGEDKFWAQKDASTKNILYNMNRINPEKPLCICEGEGDLISIIESGYLNAVSVPFGAGNYKWIEENFDWLEQFSEIIVWSDNDKPGLDMRREVTSRLGAWRTKYVDLPLQIDSGERLIRVKDANEVLYNFGKEKVLEFIANAQQVDVQNVVDLNDVEDFDIESSPGLFTGISGLDDMLYKFVFGSVVLITGRPGAGKSSLLNQLFVLQPLDQGQDVFIFSGEMPKPILRSWIYCQAAGRENISMKNNHIRSVKPVVKAKIKDWAKGRIWAYDNEDDNSLVSILNRAETVVRRFGVKVVIFDNLTTIGIDGTNDTNTWQKQKELIIKLKGFAAKFNVLVVLVSHPKKPGIGSDNRLNLYDIAGSSDIGNLSQYAIAVHRYSDEEKRGRPGKKGGEPIEHDQRISIIKNRYTGTLGSVNVYFDVPSLRFYTDPQELWKRYAWNTDDSPLRTDDPNVHIEEPEWAEDE